MDLIGFIGLGKMGRPMAANLCRKGSRLVVYDVSREPAEQLAQLGAEVARDVADLAERCDIVFTMLPDSPVVDDVVTGRDGVLANMRPGGVVVDMSTIDPRVTDRLGAAATARGIGFADAPVGRLASHAERGESLFMVGAEDAVFARIKPLLDAMGTTIYHCGGVGAGMRTKLINNFLAIVSCQMNAEAIALSQRFGLTRKAFLTPYGLTSVDLPLVERLAEAGGEAARLEDYCHSVEHSIEFQVLFLQHLYGSDVRIVPILCGPFARSTLGPGRPEDDDGVRRFLATLGDLAAREGGRLMWILGVDMAHVGRRYGDGSSARVGDAAMVRVEARDRARIDRITEGSAADFWALVQHKRDDLRWCGASPFYAFLHAVGPVRGDLRLYEQWNIDEQSVVSFAGLAFRERAGRS